MELVVNYSLLVNIVAVMFLMLIIHLHWCLFQLNSFKILLTSQLLIIKIGQIFRSLKTALDLNYYSLDFLIWNILLMDYYQVNWLLIIKIKLYSDVKHWKMFKQVLISIIQYFFKDWIGNVMHLYKMSMENKLKLWVYFYSLFRFPTKNQTHYWL